MGARPRLALLLIGAIVLAGNCARIQPPSGGPVDKEPAQLSGSVPADGQRDVGTLNELELRFDEPVDRRSVLAALRTDPPNLLRSARWPADTLALLNFWDAFPTDTTISVWLVPGWLDRHRVAAEELQIFQFATGDSFLPGWFTGTVTFKDNPSRVMHLRLRDEGGTIRRGGRPDRGGEFSFRHLPADGRHWILTAFQDVDGDSLYDPAVDFADSLTDSLMILKPETPLQRGLRLDVIDPDEPGEVEGEFACIDTLPGFFTLRLLPDSLRLAAGSGAGDGAGAGDSAGAMPDSLPDADPALLPDSLLGLWAPSDSLEHPLLFLQKQGPFRFTGVDPGPWWLVIYKELGQDSLWDPATEPAYLDPGPLWLEPGGTLRWPRFSFPRPEPEVTAAADSATAAHPDSAEADTTGAKRVSP